MEALAAQHKQLTVWAENCPATFANRAALVGAEIARLENRELDAMRLYEEAIRSARANGFVHIEALAYELAARFYDARGFEQIGRVYLRNARNGYLRWGADGKVRQLQDANPQIIEEERALGPTSTISTPVGSLDLATVLKVSEAVSAELVIEKLLDTLMRTAIEQAGAERGLLILLMGAERQITAEAATAGDRVVVELRNEAATAVALPETVLHYVLHTREPVVLEDAAVQDPFSGDPYIRSRSSRSIVAAPLIARGKLIGVLYLENNLARSVFAPARSRGPGANRVAGSDRAGELTPLQRCCTKGSEDPPPGRRQHCWNFHLGLRGTDFEANNEFLKSSDTTATILRRERSDGPI